MIGSETSKHRPRRAEKAYAPLDFHDREPRVATAADEDRALPAYRAGDCETCGQWDSELQEGMCQWCRQQYGLGEGR